MHSSPAITLNKHLSAYFVQNTASASYNTPNFGQPRAWLHVYILEHTETSQAPSVTITNCMQLPDSEKCSS